MWRSGADGSDGKEADAGSSDRRLASWPEMEARNIECLMNKSSEHDAPRQTKKRLKLTLCRLLFILNNLADVDTVQRVRPSGGWWSRPSNWRANTLIAAGGIAVATLGVWRISARNEVRLHEWLSEEEA